MEMDRVQEHQKPFAEALWPYFVAMVNQASFAFVPKPSYACCGKPIVFLYPFRTCTCDRCGKAYELVVEVQEIVEPEGNKGLKDA